jgi:hypothetical protein
LGALGKWIGGRTGRGAKELDGEGVGDDEEMSMGKATNRPTFKAPLLPPPPPSPVGVDVPERKVGEADGDGQGGVNMPNEAARLDVGTADRSNKLMWLGADELYEARDGRCATGASGAEPKEPGSASECAGDEDGSAQKDADDDS